MRTVLAGFNMASQRGCPAKLDSRHNTALYAAKMAFAAMTIGMAMASKDVADLEMGAHNPLSREGFAE
jgi:hypothetical protein